ncbi:MAG: hypothetical protein ACK4P1_04985 [Aggregatilineales bacterium]
MGISTLILIASIGIAGVLVIYAALKAMRRSQPSTTSLESLWPPRYFLGDPRRAPSAAVWQDDPPTAPVRPDAPPTAQFDRPAPPTSLVPAADQPTRFSATEKTSEIPREALQPPAQTDSPLDRTSRIRHPTPPAESE